MSDITSPPLDTGSTTTPTDTDPNATNPTDPNATIPTDPNAGATDPNAGTTDPNADPHAGVGGADPNAGSPQTTGTVSLPDTTPNASLGQQPSMTSTLVPTSSGIAGGDNNSGAVVTFDRNAQFRKAIIIASAVSGAVGLILICVVIFVVYRRRNRRKQSNATFVNAAIPRSRPARPTSDSTWIGTRVENGLSDSFNEGKLEPGSRTSDAGSIDSDATLADFAAARAKSGAFSTPSHTPRPSLEKIRVADMPMVPEDPFEAPRLSMADRPRPSLDQMIAPVPKAAVVPRAKQGGVPPFRINSNSWYHNGIEVEQGFDNGTGFPVVPLITPIEAPSHWRAHLDDEFIPPPPRRDSMASLSRQSSRASSRNSRDLDAEVLSPSKKSVFAAIAKKRRSRGDSIDPFRKSAGSMVARRKSRAESAAGVVRQKSRSESVRAPKSPGGRRKSRAGSVRRQNPIFDPVQDMGYSVPAQQVLRTPVGLPQTPRTPTAARRSRVVSGNEPRTPRTPRGPLPLPPTPRTSGIQQPRTPGIERPRTPGTERPRTPGAERPRTPGTERPRTPGTERPRTPGSQLPRTPTTGRTRMPRASVPRTPTSLDDAHWDSIPLPPVPPAPVARPLPSAPLPGGRAELRLSQLSRALSEVSRDSRV